LQGNLANGESLTQYSSFNLWTIPVLPHADLVKLPADEKGRVMSAYSMQMNPIVYETLMAIFCEENGAIIHIHANVCSTLISAREMGHKILCYENDAPVLEAGVEYAALLTALKQAENAHKVCIEVTLVSFSHVFCQMCEIFTNKIFFQ
jgi:hypothetical protein